MRHQGWREEVKNLMVENSLYIQPPRRRPNLELYKRVAGIWLKLPALFVLFIAAVLAMILEGAIDQVSKRPPRE